MNTKEVIFENLTMIYLGLNILLIQFQTAQSNPSYAELFRGRPQRFVIPILAETIKKGQNLVTLPYTKATAEVDSHGSVHLRPEIICNVGCETPTINYEACNGKKYRSVRNF